MDSLAKYTPADARDAEGIVERVTPRLQHANSAVVMSAVKVILSYMEIMTGGGKGGNGSGGYAANSDVIRNLTRKLAPPLVTLLNSEPEIQYVALRNINLIVQKRPTILENEIKVFFCKYNDPICEFICFIVLWIFMYVMHGTLTDTCNVVPVNAMTIV